jgi:DNA invertase Pin-like site-specific DNA recombinase
MGGEGSGEALAVERLGCDRIIVESSLLPGTGNPVLTDMLSRLGEADTLIVWRLDRLADSTSRLLEFVSDLSARGIGVESVSEDISTGGAEGAEARRLFELLARFDRRSRHSAGAADHKIGRPRSLAPADIERAGALVRQGRRSVTELAHELSVSKATLYRYLKNTS